jgi:hypothetical protein
VLFNSKYCQGLLCFYGGHRAWMGGPRTHHWVGGSGLGFPRNWGQYAFQWHPQKMGQGPGNDFLQGHSLVKWPACPHWKHVLGFGLCHGRTSLSTVIRASCHLSFLFSLSRSFFSLSPYYNTQMRPHGPIDLDLCFLQQPTFEASMIIRGWLC